MKFQILQTFLSIMSLVSATEYESSPSAFLSPVCANFSPIKMVGDATFINTDGSIGPPSMGDMTIGEYAPLFGSQDVGVPNQSGIFTDIDIAYRAECVVTEGPTASPTCSYKFEMSFCRDSLNDCRFGAFTAYGKGPDKIAITGGTDDFIGAFGQITTTIPFDTGNIQPNGDLIDSRVDMRIKLCYYKDYVERPKEPYSQIRAADFDLQQGTRIVRNGSYVAYFDNNDYLTYNRINFGASGDSTKIKFRYARANSGGSIEIRLGGPQGQLIGQFVTINTGGWYTSTTRTIDLGVTNISGYQDLTFVGKQSNGLWNLEWFELVA